MEIIVICTFRPLSLRKKNTDICWIGYRVAPSFGVDFLETKKLFFAAHVTMIPQLSNL